MVASVASLRIVIYSLAMPRASVTRRVSAPTLTVAPGAISVSSPVVALVVRCDTTARLALTRSVTSKVGEGDGVSSAPQLA